MRHVAWIAGSMFLTLGCGSSGGPERGGGSPGEDADPASVTVAEPDFDQGYLRGSLGGVSVDGEATSVDVYDGCYDVEADCQDSYTSATVTVRHADGTWGMTIIEVYDEGFRDQDVPPAGTSVYVVGCSGGSPDRTDWDVGSEDVTVDERQDADSTIMTIQANFGAYDGGRNWWDGGDSASNTATTLLRLPR